MTRFIRVGSITRIISNCIKNRLARGSYLHKMHLVVAFCDDIPNVLASSSPTIRVVMSRHCPDEGVHQKDFRLGIVALDSVEEVQIGRLKLLL